MSLETHPTIGFVELPPKLEVPSDDELIKEIAPYSGDPVATREHIDRRLHEAMEAQAVRAAKGDVQAARALVAIVERRAKILGLDAPKEVSVEVTKRRDSIKDYTTAELIALLNEQVIDVTPATDE